MNKIKVNNTCTTVVGQNNDASVEVVADVKSGTGKNEANSNTGTGDVEIDTGDATSEVGVETVTGENIADPPNCCECGWLGSG